MTDEEKKQATPEEEQRDIPTPENWHWKITPEDIEKIKANDRDTINRVYFDNLPKFEKIAKRYIWRLRASNITVDMSNAEDITQQIYLDLPYYTFDNALKFYYSIRRTCCNIIWGRSVLSLKSLDTALFDTEKDGKSENIIDYITDNGINDNIEREESEHKVLIALKNQRQLTQKQKDMLTAYAFHARLYDGIFLVEYETAFGEVA